MYATKDELELEYDYDKDELVYVNKKYYSINGDSTLLLPIYLGGSKYIVQSVFKDIDTSSISVGKWKVDSILRSGFFWNTSQIYS